MLHNCPVVLISLLIKQRCAVYGVTLRAGLRVEQTRKEHAFFIYWVSKESPGFLTSKSHAFAVLHRELRFKFGSGMQWGLEQWGCWVSALHSFTQSRRLGHHVCSGSVLDGLTAPSLALGPWPPLCTDHFSAQTCQFFPSCTPLMGPHSWQSGVLASRVLPSKAALSASTPFQPHFLPLSGKHLPLPASGLSRQLLASSKQALFCAPFV